MMIVMGWELEVLLLLLICLLVTNSNTTIFPCVNICFSLLISMRNGHCFGIFMQIGINVSIKPLVSLIELLNVILEEWYHKNASVAS